MPRGATRAPAAPPAAAAAPPAAAPAAAPPALPLFELPHFQCFYQGHLPDKLKIKKKIKFPLVPVSATFLATAERWKISGRVSVKVGCRCSRRRPRRCRRRRH